MLKNWITCFGAPQQLHSDNAKYFNGSELKKLCEEFDIRKTYSSPYHSKGNSKVERLIRTIIKQIRADKSLKLEKGSGKLARTLFAIRQAKSTNKNSPFAAVIGREPNTVRRIVTEKP